MATRQMFDTVDVLRLEVETDPTGLVNMVQNPSGELGGWGWETPVAATVMDGITAPSRLRFTPTSAASYFYTEPMPISATQYAAASWTVYGILSSGYYRARFEWLNSSKVLISSTTQTGYLTASYGAQVFQAYGPHQAPASTAYVRLRFDVYSNNSGANPTSANLVYLQQVTVAKAATSGALGSVRTNLIPNPSFETNTTGWTVTSGATLSRVTSPAGFSGSGCAKVERTGSNGTSELRATDGGGFPASLIPVTAGATYIGSAYVRSATTSRSASIRLSWYNGGTPVGSATSSGTTSTSGWTRIASSALTAPASATHVLVTVVFWDTVTSEVHYADAVMLEAVATVGSYFDGSTTDAGGIAYDWSGTAHASTSIATSSNLPYIEPVQYLNVLGECREIRVNREALNIGTLTADIISTALDPSQDDLIRPGHRVRLLAFAEDWFSGTWVPIFTGKVTEASVTYALKDPNIPDDKRARVTLSAIDNTAPLANTKRNEGVTTIDELPYVLEGAGIPWNVNGSGDQVPSATVVAYNDNASALDQIAITRDTNLGYAWVDRYGTAQVWDAATVLDGVNTPSLDNDIYTDLDVSYNTQDCINEVTIQYLRLNPSTGETEEVPYGPYRNETSIEEWGVRSAEFTIQGLSEETSDIPDLAAAILAANADPVVRTNGLTIAMSETWMLTPDKALADVMDHATVYRYDSSGAFTGTEDGFIQKMEHTITPTKWLVRFGFLHPDVVASPTYTPSPSTGAGGQTIGQLLRPVGEVTMYGGSTAPAGWLVCDGSTFSSTDYPDLAALLGDTFGVHSGTTYYLPNLTDRFPIGKGTKALGTTGGAATKTLVAANLPPHAHTINHGHNTNSRPAAGSLTSVLAQGGGTATIVSNTAVQDFNGNSGNGPGTSTPVDVLNPWMSLTFLIRAR